MNNLLKEPAPRGRKLLFGFSPWLVAGLAAILGLAIVALSLRSGRRARENMVDIYMNRGEALIWALEAGTRAWLGFQGEARLLQPLVEETAKQPGIVYLAVTDADGKIIAHNQPALIGSAMPDPPAAGWEKGELPNWRMRSENGAAVFEVYSLFAPLDASHHESTRMGGHHGGMGRRMGRGMGMGRGMMDAIAPADPDAPKPRVFVGLDQKQFDEALAGDNYRNLLTAAVVAALALGGFAAMLWAHHYRRSRRLLLDARALASEVVTSLPLGLMTVNPDGTVGLVNPEAQAMLSPDGKNLAGLPLAQVPGADWPALAREAETRGTAEEMEAELAFPSGRRLPLSLGASRIASEDGVFLGHLLLFRDIGQVKRLQAEVERNQRLTALGNLAAGVAHEIRNPLSSIKGLATYLANKAAAGGREEEAAKTMIGEVNRLNSVVSELLEFARPGAVKLEPADVNQIVAGALRLAEADLRSKNITVAFTPRPVDPAPINRERLTQALLNLFLNAVQAMDEGGVLSVEAFGQPERGVATITVTDNGTGMPDEVRASIFTPYFTTKPSGTGLGLAIVHQILEAHGGAVSVASRPGAGSVFTISLPMGGNG